MVTARGGHSLPELIVTLLVVAAVTGAIGASTVLGARWTAQAGVRQEALAAASAVTDSLLTGGPGQGGVVVDGFLVVWRPEGDRPELVVHATAPSGDTLVTLRAAWLPAPPVLPLP